MDEAVEIVITGTNYQNYQTIITIFFTGLNGLVRLCENLDMELELDHNYSYTGSSSDQKYKNGILIEMDNFLIDGHGYTIDCKNGARLFEIKANNVTIKNGNKLRYFISFL